MILELFLGDREATLFQTSDAATPWSSLSWGVFVPALFVGNVVVAILAWFIVELTVKLM
jgi:hypothetical protein